MTKLRMLISVIAVPVITLLIASFFGSAFMWQASEGLLRSTASRLEIHGVESVMNLYIDVTFIFSFVLSLIIVLCANKLSRRR